MLPGNVASTFPVTGRFQSPDNERTSALIDQEYGGIALNDASQGLRRQIWTLSYQNNIDLVLQPQVGPSVVAFSASEVAELALAFDQNMRPIIAYRQGETVFLRWWDSLASAFTVTNFGTLRSPRLCMDDKRESQRTDSDVIFAYITTAGALCYRQQRDRYETQRVLRSGLDASTRIKSIGMTKNWRLQFELV